MRGGSIRTRVRNAVPIDHHCARHPGDRRSRPHRERRRAWAIYDLPDLGAVLLGWKPSPLLFGLQSAISATATASTGSTASARTSAGRQRGWRRKANEALARQRLLSLLHRHAARPVRGRPAPVPALALGRDDRIIPGRHATEVGRALREERRRIGPCRRVRIDEGRAPRALDGLMAIRFR